MKRWLTIIVLVVTAVMALAQGDDRSFSPTAPLPTAILTQDNGDSQADDTTPLLALSTGAPMQLCGTGHTSVKSNRNTHENPVFGKYSHILFTLTSVPKTTTTTHTVCRTYVRAADRYIYFLRRIII